MYRRVVVMTNWREYFVLWFRSPVVFFSCNYFIWYYIIFEDKCSRKKCRCFIKYFGSLDFPFRAEYGFPVVVQRRTEGIRNSEGNVRTRRNPVSVHEKKKKMNSMDIPFFLSYGAPLARAFGPRGSSATNNSIIQYENHFHLITKNSQTNGLAHLFLSVYLHSWFMHELQWRFDYIFWK